MNKKDDALKLAEDALKRVRTQDMELVQLSMIALAAIREALTEQPAQQEPVTHCEAGPEYCPVCHKELNPEPAIYPDEAFEMGLEEVAFYTSPPASKPWVGLTNKDIYECEPKTDWYDSVEFGRAIEAKLREKNA